MSEETENQTRETDARIVENLSPTLIVGSNDEEIQNSLTSSEQTENFSQIVSQNLQEHQTAIADNAQRQSVVLGDSTTENDWQANFTNVSISNSAEAINQDVVALSILSNKSYSEQLLKNKAIVFESVQTDAFGKPKVFAGLKMLQITKDIKTQQPTLTLSRPQRYDFQAIDKKNSTKNDLTVILDYDISNEIQDKLTNKFGVKRELSTDKDLQLLFRLSDKDDSKKPYQQLTGKEAFLVINAIQRLGHRYLLNEGQRSEFIEDLEKNNLVDFSKETETNVKGAVFTNSQKFSMKNVPTTYKGVKLTPLQSFQLAKGNPVSIEGIKDDKVEGLYTANVKLDVFNGKKIEGDRKVSTESLDKGMGINAAIEKTIENKPAIPTPQVSQQRMTQQRRV